MINPLPVPKTVIEHHLLSLGAPMKEWAAKKRIPPGLLLTGAPGVGKRSMAYFLAQWILCEKSPFASLAHDEGPGLFGGGEAAATTPEFSLLPCGECLRCQRAIKAAWVDFTEITSEDDEDNGTGTLKIDQFRKLKSGLGFGAHEGAFKILLIANADRMTPQAANSVLKMLEEPPPGWLFFLTASDPTLVLPTVLSRVQTIRLRPFSAESLRKLLSESGIAPDRQPICAELAQGSWNKAISMAGDEVWEQRKEIFNFLRNPQEGMNPLVDAMAQSQTQFELLADQLEQCTSDLIRWSVSPETHAWANRDGAAALAAHAKATLRTHGSVAAAREFWIARAERLARARRESLAPLNRKLLVADVLLPWLEATG